MIACPLLKNTANPGKVVPRRASSANIPPSFRRADAFAGFTGIFQFIRRWADKFLCGTAFAVANAPGEIRFCFRNNGLPLTFQGLITKRIKLTLNARDLRVTLWIIFLRV